MKKIYKLLGVMALFLVSMVGLVGCKPNDSGSLPQNPTETTVTENKSITISFDSRYGNLSFKTIEKEKNSDDRVYLDSVDFPKITNEGDQRIFDKWVYDNGVEYSSDISISSDITLHATFVESEFIWVSKWEQYEDSLQYYGGTITQSSNSFGGNIAIHSTNDPSTIKKTAKFRKIKKSDCMDEYVTKSEFNQLRNKFCFTTSSNGQEKIVTENDVTGHVYEYNALIVISGWCYSYNSTGYLPKGYNLYESKKLLIKSALNTAMNSYLRYFCETNTPNIVVGYKHTYGLDLNSSKHFVIKNSTDYETTTLSSLRAECNDESYSCDYKFDEDFYYAFVVSDYIYSYLFDTNAEVEYFSYMAKDWTNGNFEGDVKKGLRCSKEKFEQFRQQYLPDLTYYI